MRGRHEFASRVQTIDRTVALCVVFAIAVAQVAGCNPANERPDLAQAVHVAVAEAGDGGLIDLSKVVPAEWDTVYGFPGYTSDAEVSAATGADFGSSEDSRINQDGFNLAVLMKDGRIAAWFILNQGDHKVAVRFDESLYGQPISRDQAIFTAITRENTVRGQALYRLTPRN